MARTSGRLFLFAILASIASTNPAGACGWDGCLFSRPGTFVSNAGRDVANAARINVQSSIDIVKHMSQGDVNGVYKSLGQNALEGNCIWCKHTIDEIAGEGTTDKLEGAVGQGMVVIVEVASESSMFVTYDAVSKKSLITLLKPPEESGAPGLKTPPSGSKQYQATAQAVCIVATDKTVFAGFGEMPQVKDVATGAVANVLDSELRHGDTISIDAPACPNQNSAKLKQKSITHVSMLFDYDNLLPRAGQKMKYYMYGSAK